MIVKERFPSDVKILLRAETGSARYGYESGSKDRDWFLLTRDQDSAIQIESEDFFLCSAQKFQYFLCHPIIMGAITGSIVGNNLLCAFLTGHRRDLIYAAPGKTADFGLDYIAVGERYKFISPIKAGLRTAHILSHMVEGRDDPFLLSDEEKVILIRARTGDVPPEERAEIYRRTICPANLDKLRRMPENTRVRDELFALLDEICKEETP